jgi:hypothetical protein
MSANQWAIKNLFTDFVISGNYTDVKLAAADCAYYNEEWRREHDCGAPKIGAYYPGPYWVVEDDQRGMR